MMWERPENNAGGRGGNELRTVEFGRIGIKMLLLLKDGK